MNAPDKPDSPAQGGMRPISDTGQALLVIQRRRLGIATVIAVSGEIDMATAPDFGRGINEGAPDSRYVIIDLSEVTFLDSIGLRTLGTAHRELAKKDIAVCVVRPIERSISRIFEITAMPDPWIIVDSVDEALAKSTSA